MDFCSSKNLNNETLNYKSNFPTMEMKNRKCALSILTIFILLFGTVQNLPFSYSQVDEAQPENSAVPQTMIGPQAIDPKFKFDSGFEKKINDLIIGGEDRDYDVIIYVTRFDNSLNFTLGEVNKDKLEDSLVKIHKAKDVYKAKNLSFVLAHLPIKEIQKLANYDHVLLIGDGELEMGFEMDVARPTVNANNLVLNGTGVKVGMIDSGIRQNHPDLPVGTKIIKQAVCSQTSCVEQAYPDTSNHGTHVAGIMAGLGNLNNAFRGIASGASIISSNSNGTYTASGAARALDWEISQGAKVINSSFFIRNNATDTDPNYEGRCYNDNHISNLMWDEGFDRGVVMIKSAGNKGDVNNSTQYHSITNPGCGFNTIAVGAIDDTNEFPNPAIDIAYFSSRGPMDGRLKPEIVAPGVLINSTDMSTNYCEFNCQIIGQVSGTSFSAPQVSGAAALVLQARPGYTPVEVKAALLLGAKWNPKNIPNVPTTSQEYESGGSSDSTLND